MSRSGPNGQLGMKPQPRRTAADDLLRLQPNSQPITQPSPHWPQQQAYGQQPVQGYHFSQPDAAQGYAEHAPVQSLPFPPQSSGQQLPFNRHPQPVADQDPNYGYAQPQQPGSAGPPWGQADPRGYDLGSYMAAPGQQGYAQADPGQFQQPEPFGAPQGYGETDAEFDEAMAEEEEEPRRGRRGLMIVAALVGAIGLGGGMAYGYKTFFPSRSGPAPVIKDTQGPAKSKPEVADGKGFAHTDKKLLDRLGGDASPAAASDERAGDDPNAPRKVRLIPIAPGGPQQAQEAPPAAPPGLIVVPGMTVENMGPPPARVQFPPQGPPSAARVQLPPPVKAAPQQPPVKVASASMQPPAAAEPAAPVKKAPVKAPVPKREASAAPAATASSGAGYVAVLSSQKTRMDALKIFANMQEKYGGVLSSKTPDVQEANLGEKGVWYRLVVGPPGSRDSAATLCTQLKTAGYTGCWVTSY
jgi:sporulation related protein